MSNISSIYNNCFHFHTQKKNAKQHYAWFYLKKEAVCFRNVACCFEYFMKMESVLVNAAHNIHLKHGLMGIALRKPNDLSQNII